MHNHEHSMNILTQQETITGSKFAKSMYVLHAIYMYRYLQDHEATAHIPCGTRLYNRYGFENEREAA